MAAKFGLNRKGSAKVHAFGSVCPRRVWRRKFGVWRKDVKAVRNNIPDNFLVNAEIEMNMTLLTLITPLKPSLSIKKPIKVNGKAARKNSPAG